jgi:Flp pilus assembly protein TadG
MFLAFLRDVRGNIAVTFALLVPVIGTALALAVDYTAATGQQRSLQAVADMAALTAAKEMYLANADAAQITAVANSTAQAQFTVTGGSPNSPLSVSAQVINSGDAVEVVVAQDRQAYFSQAMMNSLAPVSARAVARPMGGGRLCVLALDEDASTALNMRQFGVITAPTCAVYSNATSASGIDLNNSSLLIGELICSAGGAGGISSAYEPSATTDCPQVPDPLADRAAPPVGGCDYNNHELKSRNGSPMQTLYPGVYCGGLLISGGDVVLEPGIYVINGGELWIKSGAQISGENVGFYFSGARTHFYLESNSVVDLTAPSDGPMAGILFFQDRNADDDIVYEISSNQASVLLGTIYLPRGELSVSSNARVADQSAWTALIVGKLSVSSRSNLVLNTAYGQTDIPVPSGVNSAGSTIVLEQ